MEFHTIGYFVEYYVSGKFIGSINVDKPDRDVYGYNGKVISTLESDIVLDRKKKIKAGTEVTTMLFPINGRLKKEINESV